MNIDPKKLAEEATSKVAGLSDKLGDVIETVKEKAGDKIPDSLKEKAAEALGKGADLLDGFADKLKK